MNPSAQRINVRSVPVVPASEEELLRRLQQQEAIANVSQAALCAIPLDELFALAARAAGSILDSCIADLLTERDPAKIAETYERAASITATDQDAHFVRSIAGVLALAIERERSDAQRDQAIRLASLGRLAATIAHEFNNVLMGISPFVELLRRDRPMAPERRAECLDHIGSAILRGKRVTAEILRFTQPADPMFEIVTVGPWAHNLATELRSILGSRHEFVVKLEDPSICMHADPSQIHQIIINLVLNARDAMPNGGLINMRIETESADPRVHIVVEDHGCGMPPEVLCHIFEPLFTTKRNGTGLGLPLTEQVVQRHGGELSVESTVGVGTRFHVFLPRATG